MENRMEDRAWMVDALRAAEAKMPDQQAVILFSYPIGRPGNLRYSSTMSREDSIILVKQWLFAAGAKENWMNHIK